MSPTTRLRFLLAFLCWVGFAASASARCPALQYHKGQVWEDSPSNVFMSVSIPLDDFAPSRLICLAEDFKKRYHDRKSITILIFGSRDAAVRYTPSPPDYAPANGLKEQKLQNPNFWRSQLHGFYLYDTDKREDYLDIRPFGSDAEGGPYDTRINLQAVEKPVCRLEVSGRCLLALQHISYPDAALSEKVSGTVTLSGSITRGGRIANVKATEIHVDPPAKQETLVNEAIQNLETWRVEAKSTQDPIRITYSYVIDPSLNIPVAYHRNVDVQLRLPNQITIRGRSLE